MADPNRAELDQHRQDLLELRGIDQTLEEGKPLNSRQIQTLRVILVGMISYHESMIQSLAD